MTRTAPIGVLVMAYGGPESLDEIPGYLADIRHGRPTPRAVVDEITENYRAIGGRSPLLEVTTRQVDALQAELGDDFRCRLGMRHWSPWIEEVVGEMAEEGVTDAVSLVLAPHFSALSVARYQQKVADGLELYRGRIHFEHVPSYHDVDGLVEAFAARVEDGLSRWPEDERDSVHVVFSAHSLPERVLASGDPYGGAVPRDGEPRRAARGAAGRALVVGVPVGGSDARAVGGPGPRRAPGGARRPGCAERRIGAGRLRLGSRRGPLRHRPARQQLSPRASGCGSNGRRP